MSFSEHFLSKPIGVLDFVSDIEPFVRKEEPESQTLEYKSAGSPLSEHGDVISAFVNSGGGLLIIGAPREVEITLDGGKKGRVCRGPFTPLPVIPKDDARRSLLSKVTPLPSGVLVNPVLCLGGCVIVVDADSSSYPPHQHDGTYWVRLDGETRKAPHALVESLFLQRRGPNLEARAKVLWCRIGKSNGPSDYHDRWDLRLQATIVNNSRNIAEFCAIDIKMDALVQPVSDGFHPADPHPWDFMLPVVQDDTRRHLFRYRQRSDVLHAYEWKALEGRFQYAKSLDYPRARRFEMTVDLQAKDMLRKRYQFTGTIGLGPSGAVIEPTASETIDCAP